MATKRKTKNIEFIIIDENVVEELKPHIKTIIKEKKMIYCVCCMVMKEADCCGDEKCFKCNNIICNECKCEYILANLNKIEHIKGEDMYDDGHTVINCFICRTKIYVSI